MPGVAQNPERRQKTDMHQFDQFKQDMEKLSKENLLNPIKQSSSDISKSIRGAEIRTNLYQFVDSQTILNCTVLTLDGIDGFAWIDQNGTRHDEGFVWPTMRIHKDATVEVLFGPDGERSAGWKTSE